MLFCVTSVSRRLSWSVYMITVRRYLMCLELWSDQRDGYATSSKLIQIPARYGYCDQCLHDLIFIGSTCNRITERPCDRLLWSFSRRFLDMNVRTVVHDTEVADYCPRPAALSCQSRGRMIHQHPLTATQPWPSTGCTAPVRMNMLSLAFRDGFSLNKMALW